ncbi:hypothetical protein AMC87_PC00421 (plasmid) [Rhizobium phaseoli]|uniref:Uncharacterized protein n=1 Tax=Rhizobium sophoriradicis TaxID=1535245 RepID=A0A2A5KJ89_9HYPH|nr:hypothetical protein AMC87_PC00421 [Rhizobium phaseoli]ARO27074.1 hypothetical protein TAL182_PC00476 [Rhizobium sp. TAL182]PCK77098.1 hypothetical protein CPT34_31940 [Rhizobium sophoriradicis]PDS93990.1 hypothetical protein CO659_31485 [Rhizobium sp. S9]PDT06888.1 hypothetical protein CO655_30145 [Rhizobium sp. M1]PDT30382.1 hypothetical protein CO671_31910 [Rhizobium sp. M10]
MNRTRRGGDRRNGIPVQRRKPILRPRQQQMTPAEAAPLSIRGLGAMSGRLPRCSRSIFFAWRSQRLPVMDSETRMHHWLELPSSTVSAVIWGNAAGKWKAA